MQWNKQEDLFSVTPCFGILDIYVYNVKMQKPEIESYCSQMEKCGATVT